MRNLITDVVGVLVGQAEEARIATGVTVVVFEEPAVTSVDVRGGGPGTRETELLNPALTAPAIDAITLTGGSAFGLDTPSGVQAWLREQDRGFAIGPVRIPLVPGAITFDMLNGGDKSWGRYPPYRDLGYAAAAKAGADFSLGSFGGGLGATVSDLKGGVGSASAKTRDGITVGAVVVVNAVGQVTIGNTPYFWAAPFEQGSEFGGRGLPATMPEGALRPRLKGAELLANTTIAVVATDAILTKQQAHRLAVMAQTGLARAIYPVHTPLDGDVVFAAATGKRPLADPIIAFAELGTLAANVLSRAVARGVYEATALPFPGALPSWKDKFGNA